MKYILFQLFLILLFLPFLSFGQKNDYVWMFGYNSDATSSFPGMEGVIIDFNEYPAHIYYTPINLNLNVSSASICDGQGNLLFYTNGCAIANSDHELLDGGDNLNIGNIHNDFCDIIGYPAGPQSSLILNITNQSNQYYLLYSHLEYAENSPAIALTTGILSAIIEIDTSNNQENILLKNHPVINDSLGMGQITAVKHANGIDWWVMVPQYLTNEYYTFLLTEDGIQEVFEQQIGNATVLEGEAGGQAVFSPDGKFYIRYTPADGLFIFDFDRTTGLLSNFRFIDIDDGAFIGGGAVSPNSRYLYVCSEKYLYQFDLFDENIASSQITIGEYDGYLSPFPTNFFNAQLAPDCKIYINSFATVDVLHVIHNPDEPGLACNVEQHAIQLPFWHLRTLPYFPNYRLGPLVEGEDPPPPCEPVVSTEEEEPPSRQKAYVFPNPAPGYFKVVFEEALRRPGRVVLYNGLGQAVLEEVLGAGSREFRLEVGDVPPGLYFYSVFLEGVLVKGGKLVVGGGW
ncbi:MAG: hypothetical protein H6560_28090 [Lewinellaceae bacterium]|nr:hypothetical protein [Lewinellaceae bacterium]